MSQGSERLFAQFLDAGTIGFLVRETLKVLSEVDLADEM